MSNFGFAEYLWIDGAQPTQGIRSKARIVSVPKNPLASDFPSWSFDGSSTEQANGDDSDCILRPVRVYNDPFRGEGNYLVLCEVDDPNGRPHASNQRARLRAALEEAGSELDPWLGCEQEYTMFQNGRPFGFPKDGFPAPQGPYYCGAGAENIYGRRVVEDHARACLTAGVLIYGINAEVMPGQWEFQIGYRGVEDEICGALRVADDVWVARYLLHRTGEQHQIRVSFDNKPMQGDWNGAGMHTNFSTCYTRDPHFGLDAIMAIVDVLELRHSEHIAHYGDRLDERLTGQSDQFSFVKWGVPGLNLKPGSTSSDPTLDGVELRTTFLRDHYHNSSDDLDLPFSKEGANRYIRVVLALGLIVANDDDRPRWKGGDFFGDRFARDDQRQGVLEGSATR